MPPENPSMTFDEVSMETSKGFIKALQELKNLRPQLYSAAEYCEKSYLHSEQKHMVLDNLKDYAVRALVNAVDHLGTVAYKLTDLFEQQTLDASSVELKISCLDQQLLSCRTYMDKEGLRQQQLLTIIPRHHKHYILPNSISRKVQSSPQNQTDVRQKHILAKPRPHPSGSLASKTLSWHLASETNSASNDAPQPFQGMGVHVASGTASGFFHLLDAEEPVSSTLASTYPPVAGGSPASSAVMRTFGVTQKNSWAESTKSLSAFRSFDNSSRREIVKPPVRSKSMLSALFVKHKSAKHKNYAL
ncbi:hypothetical protein MRB53_035608 [Persea americana]|uniref:Uncharacterized protein n=1 Tax=Persea americana TaxID=3435 RepID=A0ACC2K5D4_PERAE|nr:hypothetical protein MRB53_035608 [Persea americana]